MNKYNDIMIIFGEYYELKKNKNQSLIFNELYLFFIGLYILL